MQIVAVSFIALTLIASPGLNELYPCFSYKLFEVEENDVDVVLSTVEGVFEEDEWRCSSRKASTISVHCERGKEKLYTKAICETAIPNKFRFYFVIKNESGEVLVDSPGEVLIPDPTQESIGDQIDHK